MRAVIREMRLLGDYGPVDGYSSADPSNDGVWLRLMIGPADGPGEESFDILVCTPAWLSREVKSHGPQIGRHHLVVETMVLSDVADFLRRVVESVEGDDWSDVGSKLSRLGRWEFEDYRA